MIQINEIMVGNWLIDNSDYTNKSLQGRYKLVEGIYYSGINPESGGYEGGVDTEVSFEKLDGILLTPEILIQCGFENYMGNYWSHRVDFELCLNTTKDCFDIVIEHCSLFAPIRYLHQLQNLFFALNRVELEVNLF